MKRIFEWIDSLVDLKKPSIVRVIILNFIVAYIYLRGELDWWKILVYMFLLHIYCCFAYAAFGGDMYKNLKD